MRLWIMALMLMCHQLQLIDGETEFHNQTQLLNNVIPSQSVYTLEVNSTLRLEKVGMDDSTARTNMSHHGVPVTTQPISPSRSGNTSTVGVSTSESQPRKGKSKCGKVRAVVGIVYAIIALAGLTGNSISIAVLRRMSGKMGTSYLLCVLAFWDSIFLLNVILVLVIPRVSAIYFPIPNSARSFAYMGKYGSNGFVIAQLISTWTIFLLTCHRYIAVCRPHHAARLCRPSLTKWQLFSIHVAAFVYSIPTFFDSNIIEEEVAGVTIYKWTFSSFGEHPLYHALYRVALYTTVAYGIPLTVLTVLAVLLIRALRQAGTRRAEMTKGQAVAREDVTKILISVVLVFLLCQIWVPILHIYSAFTMERSGCGNAYEVIQITASLMTTINASVNFLIYIWFGETFRKTMRAMLCSCLTSQGQSTTNTSTKTGHSGSSVTTAKNDRENADCDTYI